MNFQNITGLTIEEGDVKGIQDKDGDLLWGKVVYDTKYNGNSTQSTSPTPDDPQVVNVVTGTQTIVISSGVTSKNFTVNLGNIELCKISTYQDYIYKSGDDWYIHKDNGKVVFNGSESWTISGNKNFCRVDVPDALIVATQSTMAPAFSNYFRPFTWLGLSNGAIDSGMAMYYTGVGRISLRIKGLASAADYQSWLNDHNTTIYYALNAPTDTQIVDTALIGQLNAVHEFLTRYGYSATVSGDLPIVVGKTNL